MYLDTLTPAAQTAVKNAFTVITQAGAELESLVQQANSRFGGDASAFTGQASNAINRGKVALDNAHGILTSANGAGATIMNPTAQPDAIAELQRKLDEVLDRL